MGELIEAHLPTYWTQKMNEIVDEPEDGFDANVRNVALAQMVIVKEGLSGQLSLIYSICEPTPEKKRVIN